MPWPALALLAVALASLAGFLAYPTYPNYDSYYSLVWGRELVHGHLPTFEAYRAPTQHPLAVVFGALASLLGGGGRPRARRGDDGVLRRARGRPLPPRARLLRHVVGASPPARCCARGSTSRSWRCAPTSTSPTWRSSCGPRRSRRSGPGAACPVLALLATAGLLRPEAWVLAGVYWLWCAPAWTGPQRLRGAALVALAPVAWCAVDLVVTGNPVFSLTHTSGLAEELGRAKGLSAVPSQTLRFLSGLDKAPVLAGAVVGIVLALWLFRERSRVPLALLVVGFGTFALVALGGFSIVFRYLLVPSLMLMLFTALALAGWTLLERGTPARRWWAIGSGVLLAYAVVYLVTHVTPGNFVTDLRYRGGYHRSLEAVLRDPRVQAARRCGPCRCPTTSSWGRCAGSWARASATSSRAATRASGGASGTGSRSTRPSARRSSPSATSPTASAWRCRCPGSTAPPRAATSASTPAADAAGPAVPPGPRPILEAVPSDALHDRLAPLLEGLNAPQREAVDARRRAAARARRRRLGQDPRADAPHRLPDPHRPAPAPGEILAITFTNKAAQEMRERVELLLGRSTRAMWVMTFHAACARMLRAEAPRLGYTRQFTIYDQADTRRLVKRCLDELGVDPKRFTPAAVQHQISDAKNKLRDAEAYRQLVGSLLRADGRRRLRALRARAASG